MDRTVATDLVGEVMWLTLSRPAAMNALSPAMLIELRAAIESADADPNVRCIVITGAGKAFCAGADLSTVPSGPDGLMPFLQAAAAVMRRVETSLKPVIACVNGLAIAGGLELVLCCDIVIAGETAELGDGHVKFGLLPGGGASARLPRAIGASRARYLMFTGEKLPARTLETWGLVHVTCPADALRERTQALADSLASYSPLVLQRLKGLLARGLDQSLESALADELSANAEHATSADMREGILAFAERRKPRFSGR